MHGVLDGEIGAASRWSRKRHETALNTKESARTACSRAASDMYVQETLPGLLCAADLTAILITGFLAHTLWRPASAAVPAFDSLTVAFGALAGTNCLRFYGSYTRKLVHENLHQPIVQMGRVGLGSATAIFVVVGLGLFLPLPRGFFSPWIVGWLLGSTMLLVIERATLRCYLMRMQHAGRLATAVAIVGSDESALALGTRIRTLDTRDLHVVGVFTDQPCGKQSVGTVDDLIRVARSTYLDEIRLVLPWRSATDLNAIIRKLSVLPVDITLDPWAAALDRPFGSAPREPALPIATVKRRPLRGWHSALKRAEDIAVALFLLTLLAPVFGLIILIIRLSDPGPIFFRQERYGFNSNPIMVRKFRTMYHDPHPDPLIPQATRNDPRVTRFGAFLRRTSLDELPQLINVLLGDMSIVGPRPHASVHNEKYDRLIDGYLARHRVKPGITGWAQVCGFRGATITLEQMQLRLQHDLYYIENWSLLFDVWIILLTIPVVMLGRNAY